MTTPLEPGIKEYKYCAAGVGLVQDGLDEADEIRESGKAKELSSKAAW